MQLCYVALGNQISGFLTLRMVDIWGKRSSLPGGGRGYSVHCWKLTAPLASLLCHRSTTATPSEQTLLTCSLLYLSICLFIHWSLCLYSGPIYLELSMDQIIFLGSGNAKKPHGGVGNTDSNKIFTQGLIYWGKCSE